jgi:hypothetical protein
LGVAGRSFEKASLKPSDARVQTILNTNKQHGKHCKRYKPLPGVAHESEIKEITNSKTPNKQI